MVKVKTIKNFTTRELLEFLLKQEGTEICFEDLQITNDWIEDLNTIISLDINTDLNIYFNKDATFTVQTKEVLNSSLEIPKMLIKKAGNYYELENDCIDNIDLFRTEFIWAVDDDGTHTLIWSKEQGLS